MFSQVFPRSLPLIGVVYLPPLLGYPVSPGMAEIIASALEDAGKLEAAGYDGVLLENEHDRPYRLTATPEVLTAMTRVAVEVARNLKRARLGVEILLNDPRGSLAVAAASGAAFVRTDYFVDRMARDEYGGEMAIDPEGVVRYRREIGAENVAIMADVQVKYARMLEARTIAESTRIAHAKGAAAVVVSGDATGEAPVTAQLAEASAAVRGFPAVIGSGLTAENAPQLLANASGAIVGTGIMRDGRIDAARAQALADVAARLRERRA